MSPHEHSWYLLEQRGRVQRLRCWGCDCERRAARAWGRMILGPITWRQW